MATKITRRPCRTAVLAVIFMFAAALAVSSLFSGCLISTQEPAAYRLDNVLTDCFVDFTLTVQLTDPDVSLDEGVNLGSTFKCRAEIKCDSRKREFTAVLSEIDLNISSGDASVNYNSQNRYYDEAGLRVLPFAVLIGQEFTYRIAEDGTVSDFKGFDEAEERLKAIAAPYGEEYAAQALSQLKEFTGADTLASLFACFTGSFPSGNAYPGDSWDHTYPGILPFACTLSDTFTFESVQDGGCEISVSGTVTKDTFAGSVNAETPALLPAAPVYTLEGTVSGSLICYPRPDEYGRLRAGNITSVSAGTCTAGAPEDGLTKNISVTRSLSFSVTEKLSGDTYAQ